MRKYGLCSRIIALLLTMVMVLSALPISAFAATAGQIVVNSNHGIVPSTLGQQGAVNWPVKIYDYLSDGMLFETANGRLLSGETDYLSASVMPYAGGRVMPSAKLGTNYALNTAYSETAYNWNQTQTNGTPNYKLQRVSAVRFENPQYLHVSYPGSGSYPYMMLRAFSTAQAKASVRYMVLVYRANGRDADEEIDMRMVTSGGSYYGFLDEETYGLALTNSSEWQYLVVDIRDDVLGASRWDASDFSYISYVYLQSFMDDEGDYIDLSSVAFFSTEEEANYYGQDALAFVNDPGEYLVDGQTLTFEAGTTTPVYYDAADEPGYDLGLNNSVLTSTNGQASSKIRFGMNFALDKGQNTTTYARWSTGATIELNNGSLVLTSSQMTVKDNDDGAKDYITLSNSATSSNIILSEFAEGADTGTTLYTGWGADRVRYLVLVYRTTGYTTSDQFKFWYSGYTSGAPLTGAFTRSYSAGAAATNVSLATYNGQQVEDGWVSMKVDLYSVGKDAYIKYVGMNFPTGEDKKLDLAYVGYFIDSDSADTFATGATAYMNAGKKKGETTSGGTTKEIKDNRGWNMGNNLAWGLLTGSDGASKWTQLAGGNNTNVNGYYSYAIGKCLTSAYDYINDYRVDFDGNAYTDATENKIYLTRAQNMLTNGYYDMSSLEYDGYNLLQKMSQGFTTSGMLEGTLVNGKPVYRQETVEYVANLLYNTLVIPPFDNDGDYNYNFVKGEKSAQFKMDINEDGDYDDSFDLTGDTYAETKEVSMDLATALRLCLGIEFSFGSDKGTYPTKGTYADTLTKAENGKLMGEFSDCKGDIATCVDAAYFLLNNLFVDNSYNQVQIDYNYLALSSATLTDGRDAFVFDAGFTTGTGSVSDANYATNSQSALVYNPVKRVNADGSITYGDGTISLNNVNSKDEVSTADDTDNSAETTRFPFLPVTNTKGDYPKDTESYYWRDDGILNNSGTGESYEGRNFNYVMACNGEFVYYEDDALFFEFEGDDDVYLFINGQLVLDIGGAHAIAKAKIDVNDYVKWAQKVLADPSSYSAEEIARAEALNLADGQVYSFDFYYMERHGYGANCRIVTNMQVTDPSLQVEKNATQFGDDVPYGSVVDTSAPIGYSFKLTNTGNTKLYNLTFSDATIGVTLDSTNGLQVNNANVSDVNGGTLTATDLQAFVEGVDADGNPSNVTVTFADNAALCLFLKSLEGEGLASGEYVGATNAGTGLWVGSTVTITGFYYKMTDAQVEEGMLTNTVEISATTMENPSSAGNETLRSSAAHRVYKATAPIYYQWAGHNLFISGVKLLQDAAAEAARGEISPLNQYKTFLDAVGTDTSQVYFRICDKTSYGKTFDGITTMTDETGWGLVINHATPGAYSFYLTIFYKAQQGKLITAMPENSYAFMQITVYVSDVEDSAYVLDYGLQTETLDLNGDLFGAGFSKTVLGVSTEAPSYLDVKEQTDSNINRIDFAAKAAGTTAVDVGQGTFDLSYADGKISDLTFTPTDFMDDTSELYVAVAAHASGATPSALGSIDINKEAQMYKKVSVLPASVVYYEDDFSGIIYNTSSSNTFSDYGEGSGLLTQSVDQSQIYGQDAVYQSSANVEYSGGHLTKIQIKSTAEAAKFTFTGTGFELIGRTNAIDSGIIVIKLYDATEYAAYETALKTDSTAAAPTALQTFPVITKFDNGNNGGAEGIYQVPAVRIDGLDRKAYTVVVSGNPSYDFSKWDKTTEGLAACMIPTYLYIDGLRIFEPIDTNNSNYADTEKGATFTEVRDLIVNGKVAVAELKNSALELSTGSTTWTEKLTGSVVDPDDTTTYVGTKVDNSSDYLIQGPNNEVYMDGSVTNSAVVFYVQETGDGSHSLQIAARALDYAMFYGAGVSTLSVKLQYSIVSGDGYAWEDLVTVTSGTEQYYSVPYFNCPQDDSGNYRVVIRAVSTDSGIPAMVSYTTIKTVGLEILEVEGHGDATDLYFQDGILVTPEYYLCGTVNGAAICVSTNAAQAEDYGFSGNTLAVTITEESSVAIDRKLGTKSLKTFFAATSALGQTQILTEENTNYLTLSPGSYVFTVTENDDGTITLDASAVATASVDEQTDLVTMNMVQIKEQLSAGMPVADSDVIQPELTLNSASLSLEDEVKYNIYFSASELDSVTEMGLIVLESQLENATIHDAVEVIPGYTCDNNIYAVQTGGIAAKNLGNMVYFRVYAKLSDGTYTYSKTAFYNAAMYANNVLQGSSSVEAKAMAVALLNYGAAAQSYFAYNTESLVNAQLTADQAGLAEAYRADMIQSIEGASAEKQGAFVANGGFSDKRPTVSLESAFSINYYFTPSQEVTGDVAMYYWTQECYESVDVLDADNATGVLTMVAENGAYMSAVSGIAAKELDSAIYVAGVYTAADGTVYSTGVLHYSLGVYCANQAVSGTAQSLAAATAVYGYYAKNYLT